MRTPRTTRRLQVFPYSSTSQRGCDNRPVQKCFCDKSLTTRRRVSATLPEPHTRVHLRCTRQPRAFPRASRQTHAKVWARITQQHASLVLACFPACCSRLVKSTDRMCPMYPRGGGCPFTPRLMGPQRLARAPPRSSGLRVGRSTVPGRIPYNS